MVETVQERVLEAALGLFAERGYSAVSTQDIADAAGVKKALLFYHFKSKAAVLAAVLARYYEEHAAVLAAGDPGTPGQVRERLHALLDRYLDFLEDHLRHVAIIQREVGSGSEGLALIQKGVRLLHDRVTQVLRDVVPEAGPLRASQFFVSFSGLVKTYYIDAPVLGEVWGSDPLATQSRRERRTHLHWMVDAITDRLMTDIHAPSAPSHPATSASPG